MNVTLQTIETLLDALEKECLALKERVRSLEKENSTLKNELELIQNKKPDAFESLSATQRMALKQKVQVLIDKIDHQLNEGS
jgi:predicted  nucleic acid-binding Zn-ribbon protein